MKCRGAFQVSRTRCIAQEAELDTTAIVGYGKQPRQVLTSAIIVLLAATATTLFAATNYVTHQGSAAPESDVPSRPWQLVEAAMHALPRVEGGTILIAPGTYREAFTLDTPALLVAPSGGVSIGDIMSDVAAITTFTVLTWNTHLFGDVVGPSWQDYPRAERFGEYFGAIRSSTDVIALCEVWDEHLFRGGDDAAGIQPLSGYPHGMDFTDVEFGSFGHSGLAMMSLWPLADPERVFYDECEGLIECWASKGFMGATVVKDGMTIRVYNTHTQANNDEDEIEARQSQIVQLTARISDYRAVHPSHVVFAMGDLNVIGETPDQYAFLRDRFGALGGKDAARHAPDGAIYQDPGRAHTLTSFNELAVYFDRPDHNRYDQRLDYVWYFPSSDGKVLVQPTEVRRRILTGPSRTQDDFTSDEWSDHYPVEASFRLIQLK